MNIALIILLVVPFVCLWAGWKLGFRKGKQHKFTITGPPGYFIDEFEVSQETFLKHCPDPLRKIVPFPKEKN